MDEIYITWEQAAFEYAPILAKKDELIYELYHALRGMYFLSICPTIDIPYHHLKDVTKAERALKKVEEAYALPILRNPE